ncbi:MAG: hypothetical protein KatS3mg115_1668 [Candidatus Poribacteria bacterium]|nr:MAG: hypothetical protein KatS3mg115_1668 [Candidatus Poribacteria bacterium]
MKLFPDELENGALRPERLRLAIEKVRVDGYVVLEGVLPPDFVAELHENFLRIFHDYVRRTDPNRGKNRYQMHLPFMPPFCDERVVNNPLALSIIEPLLGEDCVCHYFASDTPLPGSDFQPVHSDIHRLFPGMPISLPPFALVLNIPLVDFREDNGPLQIWPGGTHLMPEDAPIQELAEQMHSEFVLMPAGSLLIRDIRMWHRGTPNRSDAPRPNMAMIYARHWLRTHYPPIGIPRETYERLSPRAQRLFRLENIGGPLVNVPAA